MLNAIYVRRKYRLTGLDQKLTAHFYGYMCLLIYSFYKHGTCAEVIYTFLEAMDVFYQL